MLLLSSSNKCYRCRLSILNEFINLLPVSIILRDRPDEVLYLFAKFLESAKRIEVVPIDSFKSGKVLKTSIKFL